MNEPDIEAALRASLAAHARQAPAGELLAERIIDDALLARPTRDFHRPRGARWRTWTLPLIAAGSVAAIVGAVVGVSHLQHSAAPVHPGVSRSVTSSPTTHVAVPPPAATSPSVAVVAPSNPVGLSHFRAIDLTFSSQNQGWALGTAACIADPSTTCTGLARTTDGVHWIGVAGPHSTPFNVAGVGNCAAPCVEHIRFATAITGYAFGPNAFFMTTNGGTSWTTESGGADALETLDGNVIRLVDDHSGCPGPCNLRAELATIGSPTWTPVSLGSGPIDAATVSLMRTGSRAFVETSSGQAGSLLAVTLYVSTNAGQTWATRPDPCRTSGRSAAGIAEASQGVTTAADGALVVLCAGAGGAKPLVLTSTDAGASFHAGPVITGPVAPTASEGTFGPIGAASVTTFVGYANGGLFRTTNAGRSWTRVVKDEANGAVTAPGFQSGVDGRWISPDGSQIWTTHNAGATWSSVRFH
jgi:hypothetical protein